jgi:hypothetical protein
MKTKIKQMLRKFKRDNPQVRGWSDEQVLDAMFCLAAQQHPSRIVKVGERPDGMGIFSINLTSDGSDAFF